MLTRLLTFSFFLLSAGLFAQTNFTSALRGTVSDAQSGSPLPGVYVIAIDTDPVMGVTTDIDGNFRLENVPVGRHTVQITLMGYEPQILSNLLLSSGKDLEVNAKLQEQITFLEGAEIVAEDTKMEPINEMATVSARSFSIDEAMRYSGSLQDPSRMAQNYAGVSNASDDRNDIIIRGNSPSGVLWRMEGIDIPSPNHFSTLGGTGGPVSMLNINNLSNSDFLTSAFPSEYGNALAGVFDLRLRNGNKDEHEFLGQIGFNGFELGAEGPLKTGSNSSFLINYRYSTLSLFNALGLEFGTGTAIPEYQDLTFKLDIPTKKAGRFGLFGVGGSSYIEFLGSDATDNNLFSSDAEDSRFESQTGWVGFTHQYFFNDKTRSNFVVAASTGGNSGKIDSLSITDGSPHRIFGLTNRQSKYTARFDLNHKINPRHTLRGGIQGDLIAFNLKDSVLFNENEFFYTRNFDDQSALLQSHFSWQYRIDEKWRLTAGLHGQHFRLSKSTAIEPRAGIRYQATEKAFFSAGAGLHSQMQPIPSYFTEERIDANTSVLTNDQLDFNKSIHTVLGYDQLIGDQFRLKIEAYYQYLYNIAVDRTSSSFSMLNVGADFSIPENADLMNEGTGENYGLEFTLERFFSKGYYVLGTASLFESTYKGSDGIERSTAFNGQYVFNLLGGKEFRLNEKRSISFDTRVTYAGGRWFTPLDLEESIAQNQEVRPDELAFSDQNTPYFRLDFKISYRSNGSKIAQQFSIDLRNLTNNENVFAQSYNARSKQIETTYQLGFFPDVQYRIYF
jgi:hypothetical protein